MYLNRELALRMESCIRQTHIEIAKLHPQGRALDLHGGAACYLGKDSFFSQVVSWGFRTRPRQFKDQIETIEQFYRSLEHPRVDIELCPFVGNDLFVFLSQRGYGISELSNVSFIDLKEYQFTECTPNFTIRTVSESEFDEWAKRVAFAFGYPQAQKQFSYYIRIKGVTGFVVDLDNEIVSGSTMAVHGSIADLGVTSTFPVHRGKGMQKQLLLARLNAAKNLGLDLAIVTTEPGSISDLNIQKVGFHCAYTRIKMTKEGI